MIALEVILFKLEVVTIERMAERNVRKMDQGQRVEFQSGCRILRSITLSGAVSLAQFQNRPKGAPAVKGWTTDANGFRN